MNGFSAVGSHMTSCVNVIHDRLQSPVGGATVDDWSLICMMSIAHDTSQACRSYGYFEKPYKSKRSRLEGIWIRDHNFQSKEDENAVHLILNLRSMTAHSSHLVIICSLGNWHFSLPLASTRDSTMLTRLFHDTPNLYRSFKTQLSTVLDISEQRSPEASKL